MDKHFKSCYCYYDMVSWSALSLAQKNFDTTKMWVFFSHQNFLYSTLYSEQLPTIASTSLMESIHWFFHNHMLFVCPDSTFGQCTECNTSATTVPQETASQCFSPLPMYTKANYPWAGIALCVIVPKKPRSIQDILLSSGQRENTSLQVFQFSAHCNYQILGLTMQTSS